MAEKVELDVYKDWLGIPEGPRPPDHYELLRLVRFEDDTEKIRKHYKKLNAHVRKYASGQFSVQSQDLLNELAKAMLCLTDPERKREYDESLGREVEAEADQFGRKPLGQVLVEQKLITRDQMREAEGFADARGLSMRDAVVQLKLVDAETATKAYARELGLSYVDLAETTPDDSVLDKFPRGLVKRHSILPLFLDEDMLLVACMYEPTHELEDEVRLRTGLPMRGVMATPLAVNQGLAKFYAPGMRESAEVEAVGAGKKRAGKKSGKAGTRTEAAPARKKMSQLNEGEKSQRKQMGILIMCWVCIAAVLIDMFLIKPLLPLSWQGYPIYATTLIAAPSVVFWVTKVYWK